MKYHKRNECMSVEFINLKNNFESAVIVDTDRWKI